MQAEATAGQASTGWVIAASLASLGVLSGCLSLSREEPKPVHTFVLAQERPGEAAGARVVKPSAGVLLIGLPQAQPGFDSPRMAYVQRPYEVLYYSANQWVDAPARMVLPLAIRAIERQGAVRAVVALPSSVRGDVRLDLDQLVLVHDFLQTPSRVRVAFRGHLIKLPDYTVLGSRQFEVFEPAQTEDAYGGAVAANEAVGKALDELGAWVDRCLRNSPAGCER